MDQKGVVTAISAGECKISVSTGSVSAVTKVTVINQSAKQTITADEAITLFIDSTYQIKVSVTPENTNEELVWSSDNEKVATVDQKGVVTAIAAGECKISVSIGAAKAITKVTVINQPVTLELSILSVEQDRCTIKMTPSDNKGYYFCTYTTPQEIEGLSEAEIIERLFKFALAYADQLAASFGKTLTDILHSGPKSQVISGLKPNTEYEMDITTRRNLELTSNMRTKEKKGTLLWVLDKTKTAPGARVLRHWIEHPLLSSRLINNRARAVEELYGNFMLRENITELLSGMLDLERLMTKIVYGTANGKDLRAVSNTIAVLPELRELISDCESEEMVRIYKELDDLSDVHYLIDSSISIDPPFSVREGGIVVDGYNSDVDYLRSVMKDGKGWIERVASEEREATGIKTLKIGYNKVFGYYIEVSKSFMNQTPDRYIRKQTLANCERYITEELKDMESTILGASDRVCALEYDIFQEIRSKVAENSERIQKVAALIATLDVYVSLATVAAKNRYVRPEVDDSTVIEIKDGRHPVVEQFVKDDLFS